MAKVGEFAFNVVSFGLVTTLLAVWWGDETFNVLAVLVRGTVFALVMLASEQWKEWRAR